MNAGGQSRHHMAGPWPHPGHLSWGPRCFPAPGCSHHILLPLLMTGGWWLLTAQRTTSRRSAPALEASQAAPTPFLSTFPPLWATRWGACHSLPPHPPTRLCLLSPQGGDSLHLYEPKSWASSLSSKAASLLPFSMRPSGLELTSQTQRTPLGSSRSPGSGRPLGGSAASESLQPAAGKSSPSTTCRERGE